MVELAKRVLASYGEAQWGVLSTRHDNCARSKLQEISEGCITWRYLSSRIVVIDAGTWTEVVVRKYDATTYTGSGLGNTLNATDSTTPPEM